MAPRGFVHRSVVLKTIGALVFLGSPVLLGADAAAFVSETVPSNTQEAPGASYAKSWTIQNTGTTTWNSSYSFQFVSGNAGCNHNAAFFTGVTTVPGGAVTFTVQCTAPTVAGTYREDWRLVGPSGTIPVSGSATIWVQIVVSAGGGGADAATLVSETVPDNTPEPAGASYTQVWTIRNTGTTTWDHSYRFQYVSGNAGCGHGDYSFFDLFGLRFSLVPNTTVNLSLACVAPNAAGTYREDWRLVGPSGTISVSGSTAIRVQIVVTGGGSVITTVAGNGGVVASGDGFLATSAGVPLPMDVALDSSGNLYISAGSYSGVLPDCIDGCRIRRVLPDGTIETFASVPLPTISGVPVASQTALSGLSIDQARNVYVAQYSSLGNRIVRVDQQRSSTTIASNNLGFDLLGGGYNGLAIDASGGGVFAASPTRHQVLRVSPSGVISAYAGRQGVNAFGGDNGPASSASLNSPRGLAVDGKGNLYIADSLNHRVRRIDPNGIITTVAGSGGPDGGFAGDGGPAVNARLNTPEAVAVDSSGNLYVADSGNSRVRKVDGSGVITTVAGSGVRFNCFSDECYSGDGGPAIQAQLSSSIHGIVVDSQGNLYIADSGNNRVRKVTPNAVVPCSYSLSSSAFQAPAAGDNIMIDIQTGPSCAWIISGLPSWITVSGASSGTGPASVTLVIGVNSGAARNAILSIAGVSVSVNQQAAPPPPTPTCNSVSIDSSLSNDLLDVTLTASCDAILTVRNNKDYWTNFQISGSASFSPAGSSVYATLGLLPPSGLESTAFRVHFSRPNETISIFVDPTGQTGNGAAKWMNVAQVIVNATPLGTFGTLPLLISDYDTIAQAFAQMPHLQNASVAISLNPPDFTAYLRELGLFASSLDETSRFALMVATVAASHAIDLKQDQILTGLTELIGWPVRIAYATYEALGNVNDFAFRFPAGSVLLTAH